MRLPVTSDPLAALLKHNHWAMHRIFELCSWLTPSQFHQSFEIGFGSLHDTIRHMVSTMRAWTDRAAGRSVRGALKEFGPNYSLLELTQLFDEASADIADVIQTHRSALTDVIYADFDDCLERFPFTRGVVFVHALVHGTHHRAQCLNMLRQLGVNDLPDLDVNEWQYHTECKP